MSVFANLFKPLPSIVLNCTSAANHAFNEPRNISIPVDKHITLREVGGITYLEADSDPSSPFTTELPISEVTKLINEARGVSPT